MDIRQGIFDTAQALGIQPVDLATAISYETAGTFDPTKRGPTTQWGQHRGLIQFGEPQAKKYGVDWNNPLGSQLGPQGAVANYLRDTGVKPGMGLLDIYSAINAGGVGLYNRSDANNGGAPGSVRDKVEKQMAGHRRKAEQMFGSQGIANDAMAALGKSPQQPMTQTAPQGAAMQPEQQRQNMFLKNMDPATRDRLILAMQGMTMNPNQGLMGMAQQNMQDRATAGREAQAEAKGAEQRNRTAEWLMTQPGGEQYAQAIADGALPAAQALQMWQAQSKGPDQTAMQQQYAQAVQQGYQGTLMDYQKELKQAGAATSTVNVNNGNDPARMGTIPQGYTAIPDPTNDAGYRMVPIPGGPEDQSEKKDIANKGTRRSGDVVIEDIGRVIGKMDDGGLPVAGMGGGLLAGIPGTDAHDASKLLQTIRANVGFDRLQQMRDSSPTGGALGAINQSEMTLLNSALGSLEQSQSPDQFRENLERLRGIYEGIVHGAGGSAPEQSGTLSDDDLLRKYGGN